ncbi:NAD(P)H-binding protein [Streptomyces sp. NPDC001351]|uniref:NAD(P)H-binding protein n=1 Tax=Streptomyces sp. NPDC001351 TaxID=3364564 RepID=UPI0036759AEC
MTAQRTFLITAATGNVGPHAAAQLLATGATVRALVLKDDPNIAKLPEGVELHYGDLADPDSLDPALDGVHGVFWMWPFFTLSVETAPAVLAKIERQAERIVLVSSVGVHIGLERRDNNCHAYLEELIEQTSLDWTFLRTTGFMANAFGFAGQIKGSGTVHFPHGAAARTSVHEGDLAAVGVHALTEDGHAGKKYLVTGPEALTQEEQVHIIGEVIGRQLGWQDVQAQAAREEMVKSGWPPAYADGALDYFAMLTTQPEVGSTVVADVTGRPARTFREWVEEHADAFRAEDTKAPAGAEGDDALALLWERVYDPLTTEILASLPIGRSWRCLEVGAGAGSMSYWLAAQADQGSVIALDTDISRLDERRAPNLTVVQQDVAEAEFEPDSTDLILARAVFEHLPKAEETFERVVRWLAPGGWILLEDFYFLPSEHAVSPAARALIGAYFAGWKAVGADMHWGRRLPSTFARAGLTSVSMRVTPLGPGQDELDSELIRLRMKLQGPAMIEQGVVSAENLEAFVASLDDPRDRDVTMLRFCVWGQKPER